MAAQLLQEVSQDEREKAIMRSRRMAETDRISDLLTAERRGKILGREEGITEGLQQGLQQGQEKVLAFLEQGLSLEEIKQRLR